MTGDRFNSGMSTLADALRRDLEPEAVQAGQSLARYTTIRVGGPADLLVKVESTDMLRQVVTAAWQHGVCCRVLGGGSNVLVSDAGWRGLIVMNRARTISLPASREQAKPGETVSVHSASGASLSTLARRCLHRGLAGLEWATGIPGTVGGAIIGNAGAWGGNIASTLRTATILEPPDRVTNWPVERFRYGYRTSILKQQMASGRQEPSNQSAKTAVVLDAEFALCQADRHHLETKTARFTADRKASQPAGATCGSIFKNPPGDYAGRLVEAAGLKGTRRGAAEISPLHANFIINRGGASAADIKALIDLAQTRVRAQFGVHLELEIELLGEW